jgi:hypothetical protein
LEDWSELRPLLDRLLADPAELLKRHLAMREWWESVTSEPAVARYLAQVIRSRPTAAGAVTNPEPGKLQ